MRKIAKAIWIILVVILFGIMPPIGIPLAIITWIKLKRYSGRQVAKVIWIILVVILCGILPPVGILLGIITWVKWRKSSRRKRRSYSRSSSSTLSTGQPSTGKKKYPIGVRPFGDLDCDSTSLGQYFRGEIPYESEPTYHDLADRPRRIREAEEWNSSLCPHGKRRDEYCDPCSGN